MQKIRIPIIIPAGLKPIITQAYGATGDLEFYKKAGINIPFHNGVDLCTSGTDRQNYGCAVITPTDGWVVFKVYDEGNPMSANGNEVILHSSPFDEDGVSKVLELRFVHLSQVIPALEGSKLPSGTTIGYTGNSGLVSPAPTPDKPYAGTHLHLGMIEYKVVNGALVNSNVGNGVYGLIDPMTRLDINLFTSGVEDVTKDAPPLSWAIQKLGLTDTWAKIQYVLKLLGWVK